MSFQDKIRNPDCTLCPLHEGAEHVCLMGDGGRKAKIMVVGEAPGAREDESHRAFVGPAGKVLEEALRSAGIARKDCYITNVAKCRPPGNRTPTRKEVKTCVATYLELELEAVEPRYIMPVGNAALQGVLGKSGITKHRGKVIEIGSMRVLPTFHPAAVLRNPRYGPEFRRDVQAFGRLVRGESASISPTRTSLIRTKAQLRALRAKLLEAEVISFDLETYTDIIPKDRKDKPGTQEWHGDKSKIVTISFTMEEGRSYVVPIHHVESPWKDPIKILRFLKPALERADCKYIAQNGKFDCRWLAAKGIFTPLTFDTMLANHILDENRPKSLDFMSQVILGADDYNDDLDKSRLYYEPLKRVARYNGKDSDYTLRLYYIFRKQLIDQPRLARVFTKLMIPASNTLTKVERVGLWMDRDLWEERFQEAQKKVEKYRKFMLKYVPEEKRATINFNSHQQVGQWLFGDLELPVLEETDGGAPSSKESVLLRLGKKHPAAKALILYRQWSKNLSNYFISWRDKADEKSRIHSTYKLFGTVTGRLSSVEPNLQQVPRDTFIRSILGAPPGWRFIEADYSQIELRIAAMLANETRMLAAFARGDDLHLKTAVETTGKLPEEITKEERKKAKAVNFGFLYGMGYKKFVEYARDNYEVEVSEREAKDVRDRFFESYPRLRPWHDRQRRLAHRYGRVQSPIGRVRHLPDMRSHDDNVRAEAERQAINSPVQSLASDVMLLSLVRLDQELRARTARVVGIVHDEGLFEAREDYLEEVVRQIAATMTDMDYIQKKLGAEITVPIEVEIQVGTHWGKKDLIYDPAKGKLVRNV